LSIFFLDIILNIFFSGKYLKIVIFIAVDNFSERTKKNKKIYAGFSMI